MSGNVWEWCFDENDEMIVRPRLDEVVLGFNSYLLRSLLPWQELPFVPKHDNGVRLFRSVHQDS